MSSDDDIFDSFLSDLGMGEKELIEDGPPRSSEEVVYEIMGGHRFDTTLYLIGNQINLYQHLLERNLKVGKSVVEAGKVIDKQITDDEYARLLLRYYLTTFHQTYANSKFMYKGREYPPCDYDKLCDIFVERHEKFRNIFHYRR